MAIFTCAAIRIYYLFLAIKKKSPIRDVNSVTVSYSADGNGNVFTLWGTCLRWDRYANESFPGIRTPFFSIRTLVWMPEYWWSWVFSILYVSYQYLQSLSLIIFPHTWTWKGFSVLLWGFLTFIECLELSWITQTSVFVLKKDFKKLTKTASSIDLISRDPQTFQVLPLPHRPMHHLCL